VGTVVMYWKVLGTFEWWQNKTKFILYTGKLNWFWMMGKGDISLPKSTVRRLTM
jgi:hypothetical protein